MSNWNKKSRMKPGTNLSRLDTAQFGADLH